MNPLDLTVIILTYNEELHIRRALENVCPIAKKVYVVDSPSTDATQTIVSDFAKKLNNEEVSNPSSLQGGDGGRLVLVEHKYPGNQALQFNWALDNLQIDTEWVLRIDADEYLLPELIEELKEKLPTLPNDVTGIELKRRHIFMGKWVKHGVYPVIIMRMFRNGYGRYDNRLMDEHIVLKEGKSIVLDNDFCDHSLINISDYCKKHINYAEREATEILLEEASPQPSPKGNGELGEQAKAKHKTKRGYNKLPLFWRSFAYFCYRYFLKGGFLDGKEGFLFAFIQGWWYRTLVDAKVLECKKACGNDKEKIKNFIRQNWGIEI